MNNNFVLTFGRQPYNFINRYDETNNIIKNFSDNQSSQQIYFITGTRGCGKTVFLSNVSSYFNNKDEWIVADLNPHNDLIEELVSKLYQTNKLSSLTIKKEFSFSFHGITFKLDGETPVLTAEILLEKIIDKLTKLNKKILITIDEVTSTKQMRSFAHTFQSLVRNNYPVFLLMTGLYENILELQNNKALTFLYRAPKIFLSPLSLNSIALSYKNIFEVSMEESIKLSKLTCGYAFAYQLLGYLLQENNKKHADDIILQLYDQNLSQYVYEKLWMELTNVEKEILKSFKTNDAIPVKDLITRTGKSSSFIALYRDRLIKKGIITSPSYGFLKFVLPRFNEFIDMYNIF